MYESLFSNPTLICRAYLVTIFLTTVGTVLGLFMTSMTAYVLARRDFRTYITVALPMSKASFAAIGLFIALAYWNDWYNAMLYIDDETMYPLQYFLYERVNNIEAYKRLISYQTESLSSAFELPTQTLRMGLTVVAAVPLMIAYSLVQKHFVQGITIGAVKG